MKAKMSYKSKKIAIITAVVLVLIAAISVGTYFFVQGNDNAQAAYTENDNLAQTGNGESDTTEPIMVQKDKQIQQMSKMTEMTTSKVKMTKL